MNRRLLYPTLLPMAALAALSVRIKQSFDPRRILNRGRMIRGSAT